MSGGRQVVVKVEDENNKNRKQSSRFERRWRTIAVASRSPPSPQPGMLARLAGQAISRRVRSYATASANDPSKIRNIALVAHIGVVDSWSFRFPNSDNICMQIPARPL